VLANLMFEVPTRIATTDRVSVSHLGAGHLLGEVVATSGLVILIFSLARTGRGAFAAPAVGAYIGAAYWFTSSTSFANPAVAVGRIFSDTFAGIAPGSVPPFIAAELVGAAIGVAITLVLYPHADEQP
jgi:glycerol uptake facilitator-like aquaporin